MAATTIFGQKLENATKHDSNTSAGTTTQLHRNFMNGCADYLEQHVLIIGTFSGTSGHSSLVTGVTCKVTASTFRPLTIEGANGWGPWMQKLYVHFRTKPVVQPAAFIPAGTIPVFPTISIGWTQDAMRGVAGTNGQEAHGKVMDFIATCIRKDMQVGYVKSIPGSIGSYVGALAVTSIVTP